MGSYGNLARRAVETEMPIMVRVLSKSPLMSLFSFLSLEFGFVCSCLSMSVFSFFLGLIIKVCLCVCRCRNYSEELRMLCLWPRSVCFFSIVICFQCFVFINLIITYWR